MRQVLLELCLYNSVRLDGGGSISDAGTLIVVGLTCELLLKVCHKEMN